MTNALDSDDVAEHRLYVDLDDEVLDERLLRFTALTELSLASCPAALTLPEVLRQIPTLRSLTLRGKKDVRIVVPALVASLPLTALDLDNVDVASLPLPPTLTSLEFWSRTAAADLEVLCPRLQRLPALKDLEVHAEGDAIGVPAALGVLSQLEKLEVGGVDGVVPPSFAGLTALRELEMRSANLAVTVRGLAATVPQLRSLRLNGDKGAHDVPDEIGAFTRLETLHLYAEIGSLPAAVSSLSSLRALRIAGCKDGTLSDHVGDLPALESLQLGQVNTLPASLSKLTTLKTLNLSGGLNKGALVSRWDDVKRLKPLPRVLSQLTALEDLDLSQCGVFDLAPLRPLQNLRRLKMSWSAITTVDDIAALGALEELDLEHADRVTDLAPLAQLQRLRTLNLENTRPRDLAPLAALPALRKLNISRVNTKRLAAIYDLDVELEADDEVLERYRERAALRALPPLSALVRDLGSSDVGVVGQALLRLSTWTIASSSRDANAIAAALGLEPLPAARDGADDDDDDDDDDADDADDASDDDVTAEGAVAAAVPPRADPRSLAPLDAALERHLGALPPLTLARVFAAVFQEMSDDHAAGAVLAAEVARRGDDAAQEALVDAFIQAGAHYDTGHRMFEETTQDVVIDDVLPQFGGRALTRLLTGVDDGYWSEDGLEALVPLALDRASPADQASLVERVEKYLKSRMRYGRDGSLDAFVARLASVDNVAARAAVAAVQARLSAELEEARRLEAIEKDLRSKDAAVVVAALRGLADVERDQLPIGALWSANTCTTLDEAGLNLLLQVWQRAKNERGVSEVVALAASIDVDIGARLARSAGIADGALIALLRDNVVERLRLDVEAEARDRRMASRDDDDDSEEESVVALPAVRLREPAGTAALRRWANELDGVDAAVGLSREAAAALARVGHFDRARLIVALEALAQCEPFSPAPSFFDPKSRTPGELAGDIGALAEDEDLWPWFRLLARHLPKLRLDGRSLERILAQLLGVCMRAGDDDGVTAVLAQVPQQVTWDILAFNLACFHAVAKNRDELLRYTRRSLELGKSPSQFQNDSDFAAWLDDADFAAVLQTVE